jgi:hypothetical protein
MDEKPILEKTFNEDLDVEKLVREGGIHGRLYIEVQGNNMEAAKKALESVVFGRLASERNVSILHAKMFDIVKDEESDGKEEVFSGVIEVELVSRDFRWFVNMVMRYGPSAIEIIAPEEVRLKSDQVHSLVADVSEMTQVYANQIMSLMKDEERLAMYKKLLAEEQD